MLPHVSGFIVRDAQPPTSTVVRVIARILDKANHHDRGAARPVALFACASALTPEERIGHPCVRFQRASPANGTSRVGAWKNSFVFVLMHSRGDPTFRSVATTGNDAEDPRLSESSGRIADALVGLLDAVADRREAAVALVRGWTMIEIALGPILGRRGVAALYKRSLDLSSTAHPWLGDLRQTLPATIDLAALETGFASQHDPEAIAAGRRLLRTFCDLMVSLVGLSLTERLLRPVLLQIQDCGPASLP